MFETLFGSEMPMAARFFIAFLAVLALIGVTAWLVRRFGASRLASSARGRQPRLAVIDAASVDGRRRLILIRRDNVEHLLMIGGPTDVVVEQNIVRASAARDTGREPRVAMPADTLPRAVPLGDTGSWPLQPEPAPAPVAPAPRSQRPAVEDQWAAPEAPAPRAARSTEQTDFAARLGADLNLATARPAPVVTAQPVTPPVREPLPEVPAPVQTDHNLAEMAQRLEAALRRPGAGDQHAPVTDPLGAALATPAAAPEVKPAARSEPKFDAPKAAPAKSAYDSLEQEMASLLGRPTGKS